MLWHYGAVGTAAREFNPAQWGSGAPALPSIIAETSILGNLTDLSTSSSREWPWPAIVAHADLAREAFASPTSSYLPWTWCPAPNPAEWSHGALRNGALSQRPDALAFMSKHHREQLLTGSICGATTVRANVTREQGAMWATGGNFSRSPVTITVDARNLPRLGTVAVELLDAAGHHTATWNGATPLALDPMQLVRMRVI